MSKKTRLTQVFPQLPELMKVTLPAMQAFAGCDDADQLDGEYILRREAVSSTRAIWRVDFDEVCGYRRLELTLESNLQGQWELILMMIGGPERPRWVASSVTDMQAPAAATLQNGKHLSGKWPSALTLTPLFGAAMASQPLVVGGLSGFSICPCFGGEIDSLELRFDSFTNDLCLECDDYNHTMTLYKVENDVGWCDDTYHISTTACSEAIDWIEVTFVDGLCDWTINLEMDGSGGTQNWGTVISKAKFDPTRRKYNLLVEGFSMDYGCGLASPAEALVYFNLPKDATITLDECLNVWGCKGKKPIPLPLDDSPGCAPKSINCCCPSCRGGSGCGGTTCGVNVDSGSTSVCLEEPSGGHDSLSHKVTAFSHPNIDTSTGRRKKHGQHCGRTADRYAQHALGPYSEMRWFESLLRLPRRSHQHLPIVRSQHERADAGLVESGRMERGSGREWTRVLLQARRQQRELPLQDQATV